MTRLTQMGADVVLRPEAAAKMLNELLLFNGGNVSALARRLGVDVRTVQRWVAALEAQGFSVARRGPGRPGKGKPREKRALGRRKRA